MLETIREFGLEQLAASGEEQHARARHAAWCLSLAVQAEPALYGGPGQVQWLDRLAAEHDNLRAALRWALAHDPETALRLAGALYWFWYVRGHLAEGRRWLERTLEAAPEAPELPRARAMLGSGLLAHRQGDAVAVPLLERSLALARGLDDAFGVAMALGLLALWAEDVGDYRTSMCLMEDALALEGSGDFGLPGTLSGLAVSHMGIAAWGLGDTARATELLARSLVANRAAGDVWGAANSLGYLGLLACEQGRFDEAAPLMRESLAAYWDAGSLEDTAQGIANAATLASARGERERAARLFGAAHALRDAIDSHQGLPERDVYERATADTRSALGETAFAAAWAAGLALPPAAAVALALETNADRGARPAVDASPAEVIGLTPREVEVLRLLVTGRTDREIGDALFISRRTAQGHVGHVFAKLGVSTRTAAVAAALRAGLVAADTPPA